VGELSYEVLLTLRELVEVERSRLCVEVEILDFLRRPTGFRITETVLQPKGEEKMTVAKAGVDLVILDDGKGVLFTLAPVNHVGTVEPLPAGDVVTGTSSAPTSLANPIPDPGDPTTTPPRPPDTTGLVFLSTVPQPPVDAVGVVVTFTAPFGSTAANPIDVTADSSPVGFTITESAL
jgi:hypothetical protein